MDHQSGAGACRLAAGKCVPKTDVRGRIGNSKPLSRSGVLSARNRINPTPAVPQGCVYGTPFPGGIPVLIVDGVYI
jgi:hypothetical protein